MNRIAAVIMGFALVVNSTALSQADSFRTEALSQPLYSSHLYLGEFKDHVHYLINRFVLVASFASAFIVMSKPSISEPRMSHAMFVAKPEFFDQIFAVQKNPSKIHLLLVQFENKNFPELHPQDNNELLIRSMLQSSTNSDAKVKLIGILRLLNFPDRLNLLISLLQDPDPRIRLNSSNAIQYLKEPLALPALIKQLHVETYRYVLGSLAISIANQNGQEFIHKLIADILGGKPYKPEQFGDSVGATKASQILQLLKETRYQDQIIGELIERLSKAQAAGNTSQADLLQRQLNTMDQEKVSRALHDRDIAAQLAWLSHYRMLFLQIIGVIFMAFGSQIAYRSRRGTLKAA